MSFGGPPERIKEAPDLIASQDDGQALRALGPHHSVELSDLPVEDVAVEEEKGGERLILGRGAHAASRGEMGQERRDLRLPHLVRMPLAVEQDEPANPADVRLFGRPAVVPRSQCVANPVEESPRRRSGVLRNEERRSTRGLEK